MKEALVLSLSHALQEKQQHTNKSISIFNKYSEQSLHFHAEKYELRLTEMLLSSDSLHG